MISNLSQVGPFLKVMKLIKNRERLMLQEIRKFFQEKPVFLDHHEIEEYERAERFLKDGRAMIPQKTFKKNKQEEKQYTISFERDIYDIIDEKSLVNYFSRPKGDSVWKTIKFIQRRVVVDPADPDPIRYSLDYKN